MKFALVSVVVCLSVGLSFGANPNYSYHIKIDDPAHANYQEKAETRKGPDAQGFYSVVEPNGALRTVSYTADDRGFNPIVQYSHAGTSVFSSIGTYAPAYVSEKRVQIVDKLTGTPPALNIQPFALPAPSAYAGAASVASAPVVVPAPLRVAPAPQLIAQAQGVNYAPAFMPPVTAFAGPAPVVYQPQQTYVQQQVVAPAPAPVVYQQPIVQKQVVYQQPIVQKQVIQPQVVYQQPIVQKQVIQPQQVVYKQPQQQIVYQQPIVQKQVIQPQQVVYQQPIVQKQVVQTVSVAQPATKLVTPVVTDSYLPPKNTVIDSSAPVYPEAKKPDAAYGPPSFTPGEPIGLVEAAPVKVAVAVAKPVVQKTVVQQYQPVVQKTVVQQYQPVVQKVVQPAPQVFVQQQYQPVVQKVVQPAPQVLVQQKTVVPAAAPAPVVGLYAGAVGYHTQNSAPNAYLHSYGTQGFQVTSSRTFNKAVLPVPQLVQSAPLVQQVVKQQVYAPQYYQPAPAPAAVAVQSVPAPVAQVQYGPPAIQYGVPAPAPQYGVPAIAAAAVAPAPAKLIQSAPVAVAAPIAGKKQNPLTFAYSYDQGGAKVSHSYSGSGW